MNCMPAQRSGLAARLHGARPAAAAIALPAVVSLRPLPVHLPGSRTGAAPVHHLRRAVRARAQPQEEEGAVAVQKRVAEDAASFDFGQQSVKSWALFFGLLTTVMGALYLVWVQPGAGLADDYVAALKGLSDNPEVTILEILFVFAVFHSGLAGFRPKGEQIIGARAYRVLFALGSLPLATVALVYFINHRYDGAMLWNLRDVAGVHELCWLLSFVSFFFLYPSTFNILEVAAVDEPKLHLYETGIIRITRHPQMVGQLIWCMAHTLWTGNSFVLTTSLGLMVHHLFGCWHGDRRLQSKYGEAFEVVKERTSTMPFQAIWEGRQQLPADYYKEFLRVPYLAVTVFTLGAYWAHPYMQQGAYWLKW